jgi:hypothetical protein
MSEKVAPADFRPGQIVMMQDNLEPEHREYLLLDRFEGEPLRFALLNVVTDQFFPSHVFQFSQQVREATDEESVRFAQWHLTHQ